MENRGETSRRALPKPWTPQEEVVLAQSFLSIFEDAEVGTINDVKNSGSGYVKIFHNVWVGRIAQLTK